MINNNINFINTLVCITYIAFLWPQILNAQTSSIDEFEIKGSGTYFWGEAVSNDKQQAREFARQDLSERILVRVTSTSMVEIGEETVNSEGVFRSRMQQRTRTLSRMELRGLDYLEQERRDGSWQVIAFISEDDFERTIEIQMEQLYSKLNQALDFDSENRYNRSMPLYQEIIADIAFFPTPVYVKEAQHGSSAEMRSFVRQRIIDQLETVKLEVDSIEDKSGDTFTELYINLRIAIDDDPAELLSVAIDRSGYGQHEVVGGQVSIYEDRAPSRPDETVTLILTPSPDAGLDTESVRIFMEDRPQVRRRISVDYSSAIELKIEAIEVGTEQFQLIPAIRNLRVSSLRWEIDGRVLPDSSPVFRFEPNQDRVSLRLLVNRNEDLEVARYLYPDGRLEPIPQTEAEPAEPEPEEPREEEDSTSSITDEAGEVSSLETEPELEENLPTVDDFSVEPKRQQYLNEILRYNNATQLLGYLSQQSREGVLRFGNRSDMEEPDASYVAIIFPQTSHIKTILTPTAFERPAYRLNLITNRVLTREQLRDEFRGLGSVWFEFTN